MNSCPFPPASRTRSLVRDLGMGLMQEMHFWGCDARFPRGNLLVALGFERLAREKSAGEGSSRYRKVWRGGLIELHSYCAGWYPKEGPGLVFVRHSSRVFVCEPGGPLEPGKYGDHLLPTGPDDLVRLVRPLVEWVVAYESEVMRQQGPAYRDACWRHYHAMPGVRGWLAPRQAIEWFEAFLNDPETTPRAREVLRSAN